jgi:tRNA(fMet)-specific endonuclease VapC
LVSAILDTDILSEILKGRDAVVARRASAYLEAHGRFTITCVSVLEVVAGWHRLQREDRVREFLDRLRDFEVLPLETLAAAEAGRIEADLARTGQPIGRADTMVAAIAVVQGRTLVSGNEAHYARIAALDHSLRIENWRTE